MKLVKFKDGTYGIRRWKPFKYEYLDVRDGHTCWWEIDSAWFKGCKASLEDAEKRFEELSDIGTPV